MNCRDKKRFNRAEFDGGFFCRTVIFVAAIAVAQISPIHVDASEPAKRGKILSWFKPGKVAAKPTAEAPPANSAAAVPRDANPNNEDAAIIQFVSAQSPDSAFPPEPRPANPSVPGTEEDVSDDAVSSYEIPPGVIAMPTSGASGELSLDVLTSLADTHHPRLTAAYRKIQAAQGRTVQAGLYPNPRLSASSPQIDGNESQYNGFVSQEIVTAGKLKLSSAAAQTEIRQAQYAWQQERFVVLTDLRQKYYSTLSAQRRVEILENLVVIASRSLEISVKLFEAGEGARADTLLLDIERRRAEVALKNAQTTYEVGKRQIAILIAMPELTIERLAGDLDVAARPYQLEEVRLAASTFHPQASIARLEIERTARLLQRARVEPVPNFDVMGGYQRQIGVPAANQGLFQVTMSIPLWNQNQGNICEAEANLSGARADLQNTELQLSNLAAQAFANYETAGQLVDQYGTEILPKARETLEISQNLYSQGQIDFLRLLQSQRTLLETELARIDAQEQRWVSAAALAGLLQEESFP